MNTPCSLVRAVILVVAALGVAVVAPAAPKSETPIDTAAQLLAQHGVISISHVGPYVEPGTFRVQVSAKLGQPDLALADGTWMYHDRRLEGSQAEGTLVVRFVQSRVSALSLVTPAVALAMRTPLPRKDGAGIVARN